MIFLITMTIWLSIWLYLMDKNAKYYTKYIDPELLKRKKIVNDLEFEHMKDRNKKQEKKENKESYKYILFTFIITFPLSIILELLF